MPDFLTRLASRAMGLGPQAEPVIPAMFAPEAGPPLEGGLDVSAGDAGLLVSAVSPRETPHLSPAPISEMPAQPVVLPPSSVPIRAASIEASRAGQPSPPVVPAPASEAIVSFPAATRPQQVVASGVAAATPPTSPSPGPVTHAVPVWASAGAAAGEPAISTQSDLPAPPGARQAERPGHFDRSDAPPPRAVPVPWDMPEGGPLLMPPAPVEGRPSSARSTPPHRAGPRAAGTDYAGRSAPRRRAGQVDAAGVGTPHAPATVEITIGRVEVRALHPPAPADRREVAAPAAPALSLEDYLRGQSEGRQ